MSSVPGCASAHSSAASGSWDAQRSTSVPCTPRRSAASRDATADSAANGSVSNQVSATRHTISRLSSPSGVANAACQAPAGSCLAWRLAWSCQRYGSSPNRLATSSLRASLNPSKSRMFLADRAWSDSSSVSMKARAASRSETCYCRHDGLGLVAVVVAFLVAKTSQGRTRIKLNVAGVDDLLDTPGIWLVALLHRAGPRPRRRRPTVQPRVERCASFELALAGIGCRPMTGSCEPLGRVVESP